MLKYEKFQVVIFEITSFIASQSWHFLKFAKNEQKNDHLSVYVKCYNFLTNKDINLIFFSFCLELNCLSFPSNFSFIRCLVYKTHWEAACTYLLLILSEKKSCYPFFIILVTCDNYSEFTILNNVADVCINVYFYLMRLYLACFLLK